MPGGVNVGRGWVTLPSLSVAGVGGVGAPSNDGDGAVTLAMLTALGLGRVADGAGAGAVTLEMVAVYGAGIEADDSAAGEVVLPFLVVAGAGTNQHTGIAGAITLSRLGVVGTLAFPDQGMPVRVVNVTGRVRASGGCILEFDGPPNRGVQWSVTVGAGAIAPLTEFTDKYGRAFARYDAGGYSGPLTVEVQYGT